MGFPVTMQDVQGYHWNLSSSDWLVALYSPLIGRRKNKHLLAKVVSNSRKYATSRPLGARSKERNVPQPTSHD